MAIPAAGTTELQPLQLPSRGTEEPPAIVSPELFEAHRSLVAHDVRARGPQAPHPAV
jgi:hypothetical protein